MALKEIVRFLFCINFNYNILAYCHWHYLLSSVEAKKLDVSFAKWI